MEAGGRTSSSSLQFSSLSSHREQPTPLLPLSLSKRSFMRNGGKDQLARPEESRADGPEQRRRAQWAELEALSPSLSLWRIARDSSDKDPCPTIPSYTPSVERASLRRSSSSSRNVFPSDPGRDSCLVSSLLPSLPSPFPAIPKSSPQVDIAEGPFACFSSSALKQRT